MIAPFMLTAEAYWLARRHEGWYYGANPRKPWYATMRLGTLAYNLAVEVQCLDDVDFSRRPARYPGELLDTAWERLVAQGTVRLWRESSDEVGAQLS